MGSTGDNRDSVVCHTDLNTCCSGSQGSHPGDWYFPDGTRLPFAGRSVPIGEGRGAQIAVIRRTTAAGPTGIYRCDIPTNAVHDDTDIISVRDTVYVGLYVSGYDPVTKPFSSRFLVREDVTSYVVSSRSSRPCVISSS